MKTDLAIASAAEMRPIARIAGEMGFSPDEYSLCGKHIAKIESSATAEDNETAPIVLVTAMTPTPGGEGKTTVSIGLNEALNRIGTTSVVTLREPSLGPIFGMKGGATGGGYSQVLPMTEINLHFTGDIHAVGSAHNLLAAMLDNEYFRAREQCMLPRDILWNRVIDMNDRALRHIVVGLGAQKGQVRESSFDITAASEVMAILAMASDMNDLRDRLSKILVAEHRNDAPVTAGDLNAHGAMALLLKDAFKPNLVQTMEGNPAFVHAGPFANIAHGTNSIIANRIARSHADIVVTEAGFGSDLGAEKFFNLVSRQRGMVPPSAVVIVATVKALKHHGGISRKELKIPNPEAVEKGLPNLLKHIENMRSFGRPVHVALNSFVSDTDEEREIVSRAVKSTGASFFQADVWGRGGAGAEDLARAVRESVSQQSDVNYTYTATDSLETKIRSVAGVIYGATDVHIPRKVKRKAEKYSRMGFDAAPICIAKTPASLSDNPTLKNRPDTFTVEVRDIRINAGAGFVVVYTGDIMTMPGLPVHPAAADMNIDEAGTVTGLF